ASKSASATIIRFFAGALFRFLDYRAINFWAVLLFAASTFVIPLIAGPIAGPVLLVVFLGAGLCRGILRVTSAATVAELRAEGREIRLSSGVYNAGLDLGAIIGPAAGGVLSAAFGIPAMFQMLSAGAVCVARFAGRFEVTSGPAVAVVLRAASYAERGERDEEYEHDKRRQIHQCSSWNTSDLTMTGTTPLGASGVPTSM